MPELPQSMTSVGSRSRSGGSTTTKGPSSRTIAPIASTALRAASLQSPVGVVFVVAPAVQMVGPEVPAFWLTVTSDKVVGDITTLADPGVIARLKTMYEDKEG